MGNYVNPLSEHFYESLNSKIYVDKSELIMHTNNVIHTQQKYICLSRPRRFGKSMAIYMLSAYYNYKIDADGLFHGLKIENDISYLKHKNKYDIIMINVQEFLSKSNTIENMIGRLQKYIIMDFQEEYPNISYRDIDDFTQVFKDVYLSTGRKFVILIDEWDCIFREYKSDITSQRMYLDFLRLWLKDQTYIGLAYMTGILPIKKYGTHSALNMFYEYSMTDPGEFAEYFGFTENEVSSLCRKYAMRIEETKEWYDGYHFQDKQNMISIYSPKSVVEAMLRNKFGPYWNRTETYEALKVYIQMNYDGLKDAVITMLAGGSVTLNIETFTNDMTTFSCRDDVLTLLTHLGYLTFDSMTSSVSIPNKEVSMEYVNSIKSIGWNEVIRQIESSKKSIIY